MATKEIHDLTPADPLVGSEQMPVSQGGLTRRATLNQLAELAPRGPAGPPGPTGPGMPPGGTLGQVLTKASSVDGDTGWTAPAMTWRGAWAVGHYDYHNVVRSGPWTSVVVNPAGTTMPPEPVPGGVRAWHVPDSPTWESTSASAEILSTALRIAHPGWIHSVRSWYPPVSTITFDVHVRYHPGTPWEKTITLVDDQPTDEGSDGWVPIPLPEPLFVQPGMTVDIVRVVRNQSRTTVHTALYDYAKPANPVAPAVGQVVHTKKDLGLLRVHKTGADSSNNAAMLATAKVGSEISLTDQKWSVQSVTEMGTWIDFRITPAVQSALTGPQTFTFAVFEPAATAYRRIADYFTNDPEVHGILQIDSDPPIETDDAYSIDAEFERADLSADWQIMSYSPTQ